jgi:hypothetical protein
MNKKANTMLFIFCATLFNIFVVIIIFVVFTFLYVRFIMVLLPDATRSWGFTLIFLVSIVISFLVYRYLLKFLLNKVKVEKYFDPLFVRRYKKN